MCYPSGILKVFFVFVFVVVVVYFVVYILSCLHIKEPLLLIGKSSLCGFPLSLSEWSFNICPTPYNC